MQAGECNKLCPPHQNILKEPFSIVAQWYVGLPLLRYARSPNVWEMNVLTGSSTSGDYRVPDMVQNWTPILWRAGMPRRLGGHAESAFWNTHSACRQPGGIRNRYRREPIIGNMMPPNGSLDMVCLYGAKPAAATLIPGKILVNISPRWRSIAHAPTGTAKRVRQIPGRS
jgi:hypothetical protein